MDLHQDLSLQTENAAVSIAELAPTPARGSQLHDASVLSLDEAGVIQACSESCEKLFGYAIHDLQSLHVSKLYPQLAGVPLFPEGRVNPMLDFLCHCGHLFQAESKQGDIVRSELSFVRIESGGLRSWRLIVRPMKNDLPFGVLSRARRV